MKRQSTISSSPARDRQRKSSSAGFTRAQQMVLLLVGCLILVLVAVAGVLFSTSNSDRKISGIPTITQLSPVEVVEGAPTPDAGSPPSTSPPSEAPAGYGCAQQNGGIQQGKVVGVAVNGDLQVAVGEEVLAVALAGIDLPVSSQGAQLAVDQIRAMVEQQVVMLVRDQDRHGNPGRYYVFSQGLMLNEALVRQGLATVNRQVPGQTCAEELLTAEQQAQDTQAGLWQPTRVPTRTFVPFVTLDQSQAVCDCSTEPVCSDFKTHDDAQACYNACNDYDSKLDPDHDGVACEDLP